MSVYFAGSRIPNKGKGYRKGKIVCSKRLNGHKTYGMIFNFS